MLPRSVRFRLLVPVNDAAPRQIVWRKLHRNLVSRQNPDEILAHLAGNVRQHLMLVFQFHPEHRIRQRLDDRGHDFNRVLLRISGVALLLVCLRPRHKLPYPPLLTNSRYQLGPVISFGRVKIHGPLAVTATVCSKCADGLPSAVSATHSSRMRTSGRPAFTMGSTAMTMPSCNRAPRPASP